MQASGRTLKFHAASACILGLLALAFSTNCWSADASVLFSPDDYDVDAVCDFANAKFFIASIIVNGGGVKGTVSEPNPQNPGYHRFDAANDLSIRYIDLGGRKEVVAVHGTPKAMGASNGRASLLRRFGVEQHFKQDVLELQCHTTTLKIKFDGGTWESFDLNMGTGVD